MYFLSPIENLEQVEKVRLIRNDCCEFMTRHQNKITKEQQLDWYNLLDESKMKVYLFHESYCGVAFSDPIGYGVVKIESDKILLTGGLKSVQRNKGLGVILFDLLIKEAKRYNLPICLEVLKSNLRAKKVYEKLGFKDSGETKTTYEMVYSGEDA
jgi:ribosomal protein S18 acetylase RimI-like enzyme